MRLLCRQKWLSRQAAAAIVRLQRSATGTDPSRVNHPNGRRTHTRSRCPGVTLASKNGSGEASTEAAGTQLPGSPVLLLMWQKHL